MPKNEILATKIFSLPNMWPNNSIKIFGPNRPFFQKFLSQKVKNQFYFCFFSAEISAANMWLGNRQTHFFLKNLESRQSYLSEKYRSSWGLTIIGGAMLRSGKSAISTTTILWRLLNLSEKIYQKIFRRGKLVFWSCL